MMGFKGTLQFCYPEMVRIFNKKLDAALIDPYYCDLYALNKTIANLEEISTYEIVYEDNIN